VSRQPARCVRHVDEFIDDPSSPAYAAWVLDYFRRPAIQLTRWWPFMKDHRLFATFAGKRYRVTGCSRFGDVWLASDFEREVGYEERVDVDACSEWGASP
jgi:hypothetical protein